MEDQIDNLNEINRYQDGRLEATPHVNVGRVNVHDYSSKK